jgi:predicted MFS family arabinose efflux permease
MTIQTAGSPRAGGRFLLPMLMACGFFGSATFTSVAPFLTEMSADLGVDEGVMGQLTTVSSLAAALTGVALVAFVGALAPRRLLVASIALVGGFSLLTGLVVWFPALLAFQFAVGAASATTATTAMLAVSRAWSDPATRAKHQGCLIGSFGGGALLGTPALRWVAGWGGWQAALVAYALAAFAVATLATLLLPPFATGDKARVSIADRLRDATGAAGSPLVRLTLASSALSWAVWGVIGAFLAGFFLDRHPGSDAWIARIWFADGLAFLAGAFGSGFLLARAGSPLRLLGAVIPAQAAALALFVWLPAGPLPALLAFAAWAALLGISSNAVIALYDGPNTGALLFLDASLTRLGMVAGGIAGGVAIELGAGYGVWSALVVGTAVAAVGMAGMLLSTADRRWARHQRVSVMEEASVIS